MSLYDFFFPDQAQATHLRNIAESNAYSNSQARVAQVRLERSKSDLEKKVKSLEDEISQLAIIQEAVLELLNDKGSMTRSELANKVAEIDARDGVIDGKITKHSEKKQEEAPTSKRFQFPDRD